MVITIVKNLNNEVWSVKSKYFLLIYIAVLLFANYIIQSVYYNENVFYNTYAEQLTYERIHRLFDQSKAYSWLTYIYQPIILLIKVTYFSFWVTAGLFLYFDKVSFKRNFSICLKAEYIFILMNLIKLIGLLFQRVETLSDLSYMPGSVLNLVNTKNIPKWLMYPLQTINIWELLYCVAGSLMLSRAYELSLKKAAGIFSISYGSGLLIWVLFVAFISLQFS